MKTSGLIFIYLLLILHIGAGFYLGKYHCATKFEHKVIELGDKIDKVN